MTRTPAPALSPAEAARVAAFDAAPVPDEAYDATVERVADAIALSDGLGRDEWPGVYEDRARAAIAALDPS